MTASSAVPILGVHDVRAAVGWCCDVLGFTCGPDGMYGAPGEDPVYAIVSLGAAQVHFQIRRRPLAADREAIESDAYVYVDDVDGLYERHRSAGAQLHRAIEDSGYGLRDYVVEGPDGLRIVFGGSPS